MNVNATFFAELLAFSIFIFITYRYLWPSFSSILDSRREEISKGLEAASESQKKLEEAEDASRKMIEDAKNEASSLINQRRCFIFCVFYHFSRCVFSLFKFLL